MCREFEDSMRIVLRMHRKKTVRGSKIWRILFTSYRNCIEAWEHSMSIVNKALVATYFEEMWNQRNYEFACQVIHPDHVTHNPAPDVPRTPDALRAFAEAYHAAFPNLWIRIDFQVAEGDLVVTRW